VPDAIANAYNQEEPPGVLSREETLARYGFKSLGGEPRRPADDKAAGYDLDLPPEVWEEIEMPSFMLGVRGRARYHGTPTIAWATTAEEAGSIVVMGPDRLQQWRRRLKLQEDFES